MHMGDALLSPAVGVAMSVVSVGAMGFSVARVKKDVFSDKKVPLMGVAGALVFAGQMINFTIPLTGSSGHIGGGILLAGLLGGVPAFLSIAAVLIIQCLFFADGGLLALGCNIFNMGVIPCLIVYPLIFKPLLKRGADAKRLSVAAVVSAVVGLEVGAFCVVIETMASGITVLPFGTFAALMLPIHLAIGLVEGIVTAAVLVFIRQSRPEIIDSALENRRVGDGISLKKAIIPLIVLTIIVGGALSLFASSKPDGLEWAIGNIFDKSDAASGLEAFEETETGSAGIGDGVLSKTAVMPDYAFAGDPDSAVGTSVAGIAGAGITFALAVAAGLTISAVKKRKAAHGKART